MSSYVPSRRVLLAFTILVVAIVTNAWHRNIVSGFIALIAAVALAVWLGTELGKK